MDIYNGHLVSQMLPIGSMHSEISLSRILAGNQETVVEAGADSRAPGTAGYRWRGPLGRGGIGAHSGLGGLGSGHGAARRSERRARVLKMAGAGGWWRLIAEARWEGNESDAHPSARPRARWPRHAATPRDTTTGRSRSGREGSRGRRQRGGLGKSHSQ